MSTFKGILGETVINVATWLKLEKGVYHRLNNITLPLAKGGSTQIDHVIVSIYGIFVIETKNYKGWIYGNEKQQQWTQVFPNGRKYKFQNPLRQNYLHIKTLADLLDLEISYFYSMIAFIGECELKTRDELPEHVLKGGVISYIKNKQNEILTEVEVKSIVGQIETKGFTKSWRTNSQHKAYLKDKHADTVKISNTYLNAKKSAKPDSNASSNSKLITQDTVKARTKEVFRWSGQTGVEKTGSLSMTFNSKNAIFMTPFDVTEFVSEVNSDTVTPIVAEQTANIFISDAIPTCPRCNGEMIQRVAKKGLRQDQAFYGCNQFPKCRGVVNFN